MINNTEEEKDEIKNKLKYIGLNLNNIPDFIKDYKELEFRPSRQLNDREYTVYQYVPVNQIQILLTPTNRLTDIKEKYSKAKPLYMYLDSTKEEYIENFAVFLNMLNNTSIEEIEQVEKVQKEFETQTPNLVKYEKNYLWQIYYSEYSHKYFMLVPTEETEYSTFFYLLKEQIKCNEKEEISTVYVPIVNCVRQYNLLNKDEAIDIEKYLWLFTKNWPNIYEITDQKKHTIIEIVGKTYVYDKIQSIYKIKLENKEIADKFYKLLKVLFILQTELPMYYQFSTKINKNGEIIFYYNSKKISYEDLPELIKTECEKFKLETKKINTEIQSSKDKIEKLKETEKLKEKEYLEKQKEISTYLEYKKTFIGKVKYFFKRKTKKDKELIQIEQKNETKSMLKEQDINIIENKQNIYTIEDLIIIAITYDNKSNDLKNIQLDTEALQLKIKNLNQKIKNAQLYIDEIDSHKKSIFEFWKFSSKDEVKSLNEGKKEEENVNTQKISKAFDYNEDFEELGKNLDRLQRKNLTKEEQDAIFAFDSKLEKIINMLKNKKQVVDEIIEEILNELKKESKNQEHLLLTQNYDIFGNISLDKTKIKVLGNTHHREKEKNLYQILNITEKTQIKEFKETIKKIMMLLNKSMNKTKTITDMPIYQIATDKNKMAMYGYNYYYVNIENLLKTIPVNKEKVTLFKVNLPENVPAIYYTNCIYYDNYNKTLPMGMNVSDKVLLDCEKFEFVLKNKTDFTIYRNEKNNSNLLSIDVYEYNIILK